MVNGPELQTIACRNKLLTTVWTPFPFCKLRNRWQKHSNIMHLDRPHKFHMRGQFDQTLSNHWQIEPKMAWTYLWANQVTRGTAILQNMKLPPQINVLIPTEADPVKMETRRLVWRNSKTCMTAGQILDEVVDINTQRTGETTAKCGMPCSSHQPSFSFLHYFFLRLNGTTQTLTTHAYSHPYEHTYANPTPMSIFEDRAGKSSRLTKSP